MNSKKINIEKINPNTVSIILRTLGVVLIVLALAACGSSGSTTTPPPVTNSVGPNGGTVTGPAGAKVVIPEGALTQDTEIAIAQTSNGAPALPSGATSVSAMFAFTPHGTTFIVPVTITVPFDASKVPSGTTPELLKTNAAQSAFEVVAGATVSGSTMTAQITSFSFVQIVSGEAPSPTDLDPFLDPSFGGGSGKVTTPFSAFNALALQSDGKIVMVGGSFQLARYDTDGVLDESFGEGGLVITDSNARLGLANAVAIQPDGKIVVAGETGDDFGLARYDTNGDLDKSFGEDGSGIVTTDFGSDRDRAFAVAIQSDDGKIVVVGDMLQSTPSGPRADFSVARYDPDGSLDTSFSDDGKTTVDIDGGHDIAHAVAFQSDEKIVVVGAISLGTEPVFIEHTGLTRLTSSGEVDTSFGNGGDGMVILEDEQASFNMAVQSDDKIVVVGMTDGIGLSNDDFVVMRLTEGGTPDSSFGTEGKTTTDFSPFQDTAQALALQTDDKIVVAGFTLSESPTAGGNNFALARYDTNGAPDLSFGDGGKLTVDFFRESDAAEGVAIQTDGKIIVGGTVTNGSATSGSGLEIGLARIIP
jgi:uncharacterized delta-60 repeat protein